MKIREAYGSFPFISFRTAGVLLLFLGILTLSAGIFDVIWTAAKYTNRLGSCESDDWSTELENPCENDELVWTWAACGIWGGLLILLVGIVGSMFSRWRTRRLRVQRDMFSVSCGLLVFPICPAVITVSVLQLIYQKGIFYETMDGDFTLEDPAKFVVPLIVIGLTFIAWIVALAGMLIGCCCANIEDDTSNLQVQPYAFEKPPMMQTGYPAPLAPYPSAKPTVELVGILPAPYTGPPMPLPPPMGPMMIPPPMGGPVMLPPPY
jgi:hypothetical protein